MKFTVLVDTIVSMKYKHTSVVPAHGLSILVEHSEGTRVLFSTGPSLSILKRNAITLGLSLKEVDILFIPVWKRPLAGCYEEVIAELKPKLVCTPPGGLTQEFEYVIREEEPMRIQDKIYSTGILSFGPYKEHAMILVDHEKTFLFIGCAAYGFNRIVLRTREYPPLKAIIGGLHLSTLDREGFRELIHIYETTKADIIPLFCTSKEARQKIINIVGKSYDLGVGFVYKCTRPL